MHPTKEGVSIGSIFLLSILTPELLSNIGFVDHWYFSACFLGILLSMCLLQGNFGEYKLANKLITLLLFIEIPLNVIGIFVEKYYLDVALNNYLYYNYNIAPAIYWVNDYQKENWLYLLLATINYTIALYLLIDREGRKENVGFGIAQLLGDKLLSPNLRFKGMAKWEK